MLPSKMTFTNPHAPLLCQSPFPRGEQKWRKLQTAQLAGHFGGLQHQGQGAVNYLKDKLVYRAVLCYADWCGQMRVSLKHHTIYQAKSPWIIAWRAWPAGGNAMVDYRHITFGTKRYLRADLALRLHDSLTNWYAANSWMTTLEPQICAWHESVAKDYAQAKTNKHIVGATSTRFNRKSRKTLTSYRRYKGKYISKRNTSH
jgi:hypothetical protein